jgi:hypothetical protein
LQQKKAAKQKQAHDLLTNAGWMQKHSDPKTGSAIYTHANLPDHHLRIEGDQFKVTKGAAGVTVKHPATPLADLKNHLPSILKQEN